MNPLVAGLVSLVYLPILWVGILLVMEKILLGFLFRELRPLWGISAIRAFQILAGVSLVAPLLYYAVYLGIYGGLADSGVYFSLAQLILTRWVEGEITLVDMLVGLLFPQKLTEVWHSRSMWEAEMVLNIRAFYTGVLTVPFYLLGAGIYPLSGMWISAIRFLVQTYLFLVVLREIHQAFSPFLKQVPFLWVVAILGVPSVWFWTSVPQKEAYSLMGIALGSAWLGEALLTSWRFSHLFRLIGGGLCILVVYHLRPWLTYLMIMAVGLAVVWKGVVLARNPRIRLAWLGLAGGILLSGGAGVLWSVLQEIQAMVQKAAFDLTMWHTFLAQRYGQFGYILPEIGTGARLTFVDLLLYLPQGLSIALYRPFPWEGYEPQHFLASLEGLWMLALTVYMFRAIIQGGIRLLRISMKAPLMVGLLVTALVYVAFTGLVTYNYGALSRYKTVFFLYIPFFMTVVGSGIEMVRGVWKATDRS